MRVVLFFTKGVSLATWANVGNLGRETALYTRLSERGHGIHFVTYGGREDLRFESSHPGIHVHCNRWRLSPRWYRRYITRVRPMSWRGAVFRSNQLLGAEVALAAARTANGVFVARCGYLHSLLMEHLEGNTSKDAREAREREATAFSAADHIVVTTEEMKNEVVDRYSIESNRITVIPNYVDTDTFCPSNGSTARSPRRLLFVGRLAGVKNLPLLFEALAPLDLELVLIGSGPQESELRQLAERLHINVRFVGNVAHAELPNWLATATAFVLPSQREGHPKALIEAMSCGLPVIGTRVPGISSVITDGDDGVLCASDPDSLRIGIERVMGDVPLQKRLGSRARQTVRDRYALSRIVVLEEEMLSYVGSGDFRSRSSTA